MKRRSLLKMLPLLASSRLFSTVTTSAQQSNLDRATRGVSNPVTVQVVPAAPAPPGNVVPILTRSFDNLRSCVNPNEKQITLANVATLAQKFALPLYGDKRGLEAQPLIVPSVVMSDGTTHDILIACTMANSVWCYDANDGTLLWVKRLANPINGTNAIDAWNINDHWGIMSTPVIDGAVLYCVAWSSPDGTYQKGTFTFYSLNLGDGTEESTPLSLSEVSYQPPNGLPKQVLGSSERKQRASMLLTNVAGLKTIFIPFGTVAETAVDARGWIVAVDISHGSPFVSGAWTTTSRYSGAGIWMAGQGLAADEQGYIYCVTGNGAFDGITDFGESFVKLQYTPPATVDTMGTIAPVDWWSPFSDSGRVGDNPTLPTSAKDNGWNDQDLGSGGIALIPDLKLLLGSGKDGILYVMPWRKMGKTMPADFANPATNYAKLATPPEWFTNYPGGINAAPQNVTDLNQLYENRTHHMHSTPVAFKSATGWILYCGGENGNVRAWSISETGAVTFLANGQEQASANSPVPPGGMPGFMLCLSANGNQNAILWATCPDGDANKQITAGRLLAYDATNFGKYAGGGGWLKLIWQSPRYTFNKFLPPVVSGGRVYVPTYDSQILVFGL